MWLTGATHVPHGLGARNVHGAAPQPVLGASSTCTVGTESHRRAMLRTLSQKGLRLWLCPHPNVVTCFGKVRYLGTDSGSFSHPTGTFCSERSCDGFEELCQKENVQEKIN